MKRFFTIPYISLLVLLALTALSYHPTYANVVTYDKETNPLNGIIVAMTVVTFILHLDFRDWSGNKFIKIFFFSIVLIGLIGYVLQQMKISNWYFDESRSILMSFVFLLIGYSYGKKTSYQQLLVLVVVYSLFVIYAVYNQLLQHAGGFVITDIYISYGKNTMGVMCASSCVALAFMAFESRKRVVKLLLWFLYLYILIITISIRARASYITILVITLFLVFKLYRGRQAIKNIAWLIFGMIGVLILSLFFSNVLYSIWDFVWDSFTRHQNMDDLTSGRRAINQFALDIVRRSPLFGNLELQRYYQSGEVHNYFLRQLSSYGIIGSIPILFLYVFLFVSMLKTSLKTNVFDYKIGYFVMIVPLIISLVEPTFPFAPGTGVIFAYVVLGYSIQKAEAMKNASPLLNEEK